MAALAPLLLAAAAALGQEPVRVAASLSADDVRVGESVVLQVLVETPGVEPERIALPAIPTELEVVGRSETRSLTAAGERQRREIRLDVTLLARLPGRVIVPPVSVVVSGVTHRTRPLALTIRGPAAPQPPPLGWEGAELRAWLHPDTVYVGEQALLRVEARIPEGLRRGRARPLSYEPPSPTGFWVHDLPDAGVTVLRSVGDRIIEVQSFGRAYFALDPGRFVLPPARVTYEVRRGFLQPPENQRLESDSLRLVVLPLPEAGRPAAFRGAVGRYELRASLEPASIARGDVASLVVEVEGVGNIKMLAAPELPPIDGVEVHAPTESAEYSTPGGMVAGVKRFRWLLVPREVGAIEVPPVRMPYFDPEPGEYREAASGPVRLEVRAGGAPTDGALAPIEPVSRTVPADTVPMWWLLLLLPPLVLVAVVALARWRARSRPARSQAGRWRDAIERAGAPAADRALWAAGIAAVVRDAAGEAAGGQPLRTASPDELSASLRRAGVTREIADEAGDLVAGLERLRFAPDADQSDTDALHARARRIVAALARVTRTALVLIVLTAASAHAQTPDAFAAGVRAYREGRYAEATERFAERLRAEPRDAAAWYDLGNAAYQAGWHGRAAQAWLRTLWLEPRHGAARANLRSSLPPAAAAAPSPMLLGRRDAARLIVIAWWVGFLALALHLRAPRHAWRWAMGGALVLGLGTLALATLPRLGAPAAVALEETSLRRGPTAASPAPERLPAATPLDVLERRGAWARVRDPAGRDGWIEAALAAPIRGTPP